MGHKLTLMVRAGLRSDVNLFLALLVFFWLPLDPTVWCYFFLPLRLFSQSARKKPKLFPVVDYVRDISWMHIKFESCEWQTL